MPDNDGGVSDDELRREREEWADLLRRLNEGEIPLLPNSSFLQTIQIGGQSVTICIDHKNVEDGIWTPVPGTGPDGQN
jgi:hypothetical protein